MAQEIELKFIVAQDGVERCASTSMRSRRNIRPRASC
jgi:CYTH domain-containing protein